MHLISIAAHTWNFVELSIFEKRILMVQLYVLVATQFRCILVTVAKQINFKNIYFHPFTSKKLITSMRLLLKGIHFIHDGSTCLSQ